MRHSDDRNKENTFSIIRVWMFMDFRIVFKFVDFFVLHAGEVQTGQRRAGAFCGRLKVIDDGTFSLRRGHRHHQRLHGWVK